MLNINPLTSDKNFCYFIDKSMKDDNGDYHPVIVIEDDACYYETDWNLGRDYTCARDFVDIRNTRLGLSQNEVDTIVISSIRSSIVKNNLIH
ncbi:MAG: hypothetical protein OEZ39_05280 [Gammaproteobacteria bacterium]|nr:hypothetical protein [Gammaproteobacteria bacterium]MDH5651266.1 hypothetical protein [Gammaproteobacteria bacterium]